MNQRPQIILVDSWVKKMENKSQSYRSMRGFTILEMLLAMTLFAIVMASSYGIFSMGIQIWRRTQGAATFEREVLLAYERMGRDVRSTLNLEDKKLVAEGDNRGFQLPGLITLRNQEGEVSTHYGLNRYQWDSKKGVLCAYQEVESKYFKEKAKDCRELAHYIQKATFEYWVYEGIGESFSWYKSFDEGDGIPQAIRITLELDSELKGDLANTKREYVQTFVIPVGGKKDEVEG